MTKNKKTLLLFAISCFSMLLISCTFEEKFIKENNNSKNYQLFEKKFSDIITEKEFKNSFSKIAKPNFKGSSKTIMEQQYGFEIDETAIVKEIHKDGIITYTLGIKSDSLHSNQLRNLLVEQLENNEVSAYILSYNLTAPLLPTGHNSFSLNYSTATIEPINYNANQTSRVLLSNGCYLTNVLMCSEPWVGQTFGSIHVAGHDCFNPAYLSMQSVIDCPNEGGGGGETPIDNGGSGSGGGSPTSPTGPGLPEVSLTEPCNELKKLALKNITNLPTSGNIITLLNDLKTKSSSGGAFYNTRDEAGFVVYPSDLTNINFVANQYDVLANQVGISSLNQFVGSNVLSYLMHTHSLKHYTCFSLDDIHSVYGFLINNISNDSMFTSFLVSAYGTHYAIKITDKQAFLAWGNTYFNGWEFDEIKDLKNKEYFFDMTSPKPNTTLTEINKNETEVAKFLNGKGIELYKNNGDFTSWTKISIDNNGNKVDKPCK